MIEPGTIFTATGGQWEHGENVIFLVRKTPCLFPATSCCQKIEIANELVISSMALSMFTLTKDPRDWLAEHEIIPRMFAVHHANGCVHAGFESHTSYNRIADIGLLMPRSIAMQFKMMFQG